MGTLERQLRFRIVLQDPPSGMDFGLQKGRGSNYETIQKQRSEGRDLQFEFTAGIRPATRRATPDFGGPFVQGPAGQRFIYIDIGTYAGQTNTPWSRRLKVPLTAITWELIDRAAENSSAVVETRVAGTGTDGGPNCGTVKPFGGWTLVRDGVTIREWR